MTTTQGTPTDNPQLLDDESADAQFLEAVEAMRAASRPKVRVRVLLQLYRFGVGQRYKNWRGQIFRLELDPTIMAASNFRTALSMFFEALTTIGPAKVVDALQAAMKGN
jgi:hypothetical protein